MTKMTPLCREHFFCYREKNNEEEAHSHAFELNRNSKVMMIQLGKQVPKERPEEKKMFVRNLLRG